MASQRRPRFAADLSQCLFDFVIQLLPPHDELHVKENVRLLLQRLIRNIEPSSRLLAFGSTANGFSLRNSGILFLCYCLLSSSPSSLDMDLCCLIDSAERLNPSDLVTMLGDLLERG
jgi:terminal uridylyltransferase